MNHLWQHFRGKSGISPVILDLFERETYALSQNPNQFTPIVSEEIFNNGFKPKYPEGKEFGVCLSHDIDLLFLSTPNKLRKVGGSLLSKNISKAFKHFISLSQSMIYEDFAIENLLEIERKYGANSSFYFLSLTNSDLDFNYNPNKIKSVFEQVLSTGNEIGLHGGHEAYSNLDQLKWEKKRLEEAVGMQIEGYRNHYLRFLHPLTWNILSSAGFKYDTTYGYPDCVGFKNGMCYPFRPFDNEKNDFIDIVELPLIIMDITLVKRMNLDFDAAFEFCKGLIQKVKQINGVMSILWHNSPESPEYFELYDQLLNYCQNEGGWLTSTGKMIEHYEENKYIDEIQDALMNLQNG
jgi:peptidoglycan/xylan/chitin deacetylase (PgdA/CDA1 family)